MATRLVLCLLRCKWCHFDKIIIDGCAASDENFVKMTFPLQCWSEHQTNVAPMYLAEILDNNFANTFLVFNFSVYFKTRFHISLNAAGVTEREMLERQLLVQPMKEISSKWKRYHLNPYSPGSDNGLSPDRRQAIIWTNGFLTGMVVAMPVQISWRICSYQGTTKHKAWTLCIIPGM